MRPEQALQAAREAAARERAAGAYAEDPRAFVLEPAQPRVTSDQLMEWAVIAPDPSEVVSTRRWGRPITLVKRTALHMLRQYLGQLESQQTRFNRELLARLVEQEERLATVEEWLGETPEPLAPAAPPAPGSAPASPPAASASPPESPAR